MASTPRADGAGDDEPAAAGHRVAEVAEVDRLADRPLALVLGVTPLILGISTNPGQFSLDTIRLKALRAGFELEWLINNDLGLLRVLGIDAYLLVGQVPPRVLRRSLLMLPGTAALVGRRALLQFTRRRQHSCVINLKFTGLTQNLGQL